MKKRSRKDIVIDANVMRLYDKPDDPAFVALFIWVKKTGELAINKQLVKEYGDTGKPLIMVLLNELGRDDRLNPISKSQLSGFTADRHYNYTCNSRDIVHARTVFLSSRKRCISFDKKLRNSINRFKRVDRVRPCACRNPASCCLN